MLKFLNAVLRLGVTIGLLAVLVSRLDIGRIVEILEHGSIGLFALAVAVLGVTNLFNALRWRLILEGRSNLTTSVLLKLLFVGWFFNQVLPTGIGGDAVRAWRCRQLGMTLTTAIGSILLDRASGYLVLVGIYVASIPDLLPAIHDPLQQRLLMLVLLGSAAGLAVLFLIDFLPPALTRLRLVKPLASLSFEARRVLLAPRSAAPIFGLAAVTMGLTIFSTDLVGQSVGIELSFLRWLEIVPPVALVQLLPVSLGGWGVREAAMVVILGALGVPGEAALAGSLCVGVAQILVGLPGGLIWLNNWDVGRADAAGVPGGGG